MLDLIMKAESMFFIFLGLSLVYFILQRIKDKSQETFEDRDN